QLTQAVMIRGNASQVSVTNNSSESCFVVVDAAHASEVDVRQNRFSGTNRSPSRGVTVDSVADCAIDHNNIEKFSINVYATGSDRTKINDNILSKAISNNVFLDSTHDVEVFSNTILQGSSSVSGSGGVSGISLVNTAIYKNKISENTAPIGVISKGGFLKI